MKSTKISTFVITLSLLVALAACGKKDTKTEKPTVQQPPHKVVMEVPSGTHAPATEPADTIPGQTHVKITCQCLATTNPDDLYLLPRNMESARSDTALLRRINEGSVYVVQPGESGYILAKGDNKLQIRFPDKIVWVLASNTK